MEELLRSWVTSCEEEKFTLFLETAKVHIQNNNTIQDVSDSADVKSLNGLLCAPFSDNYPTQLLKIVHLYTTDLHHLLEKVEPELFTNLFKFIIRVIRQSKSDESLEPALGVLANLSHFSSMSQQCLNKKDDFEVLRKCLLHIMSSDDASQSTLVYSMTVRFYLWRSTDKFFQGVHLTKTIQILFNVLLNGEISSSGLCAAELLSDLCLEPSIMKQLGCFPDLDNYLVETIEQLKVKNSPLVLKLLQLLYRLLTNKTDQSVGHLVRSTIFKRSSSPAAAAQKLPLAKSDSASESNKAVDSVATLFNLASGTDDLIASAALHFLLHLSKPAAVDVSDKENLPTLPTIPYERLLDLIETGMLKSVHPISVNFRLLRKIASKQPTTTNPSPQTFICSRLLRLVSFIRLADHVVQQLHQQHQSSEHEMQTSGEPGVTPGLIGPLSRMVDLLYEAVTSQLDGNPLVSLLVPTLSDDAPAPKSARLEPVDSYRVDADACLISADVTIEAMGLMYSCAELLTALAPAASQDDDEVSLTQPNNETVRDRSSQQVSQHAGKLLQALLECPETPGLFALGLLAPSGRMGSPPGATLALGSPARVAALRLLPAALNWNGFENAILITQLDRLQTTFKHDGSRSDLLERISTPSSELSERSFLAQWLRTSGGEDPQSGSNTHPTPEMNEERHSSNADSASTALEQKVDKFLTDWETRTPADESDPLTSGVLSVFDYKIRILQSRENELEASASANAKALTETNRLCEHYRERAVLTSAESDQLRILQLDALARLEASKRSFNSAAAQLESCNTQLVELHDQLATKQTECQELTQKNEVLQTKLTTAREKIHAMDATIDDYRAQLDEAKEQIQSQTTQIAKFTQITRLINDLTGNPSTDVSTAQSMTTGIGDAVSPDSVVSEVKGRTTSVGPAKKMSMRSTRR